MKRKVVSELMLTLLVISMLTLAFNIQQVEASGTIYIRADGSVEGTTDISTVDNVTYTFTTNINDSIEVERDNIVVDGAGFTLQGTGSGTGIDLSERSNVTIQNTNIKNFYHGIYLYGSSNNIISGNNITNSSSSGISLYEASNNSISGNNITSGGGIYLSQSSNNIIHGNNITKNDYGVRIFHSSDNNTVSANNIANNGDIGILIDECSYNRIYHNNVINNQNQLHLRGTTPNIWDDGYPSGGNYWSDYSGVDEKSGPDQDQPGSDGIGDTPYTYIYAGYTVPLDRYPLMSPWTPPPKHELVLSMIAPTAITLSGSSTLETTVTNMGLNYEVDVELVLLINGTILDSTTVALLQASNSHTLSYPWTPTVEGTYNVTAYAHPVPGETSIENNQMTKFVTVVVSPPSEVQIGVEAGDWIKMDYTVTGWPAGEPRPEWLKVEILSFEGTTGSVRVTLHMSDGTEQSDTVNVDVATGNGTFQGFSGFVIPANSKTGDSINMGGDGFTFNVTIDGETTGTYAGASRTVVYASFSQYGTELTYYWDKDTGVMVESSTTSGGMTGTARATETNIWEAVPSPLWMQWWFFAIVAVAIVALVGAVYFLKKRKAPIAPTPLEEGTV